MVACANAGMATLVAPAAIAAVVPKIRAFLAKVMEKTFRVVLLLARG
jgi:hypothetical protein